MLYAGNYASMHASIEVYMFANNHHNELSIHIWKYLTVQVCREANTELFRFIILQECKFANMHVVKYADASI